MAQATGTPRLRGTTVVLLQSCPFLVGKDSRSRRDVSRTLTLPHLTPCSGHPALRLSAQNKQHARQTTPACLGGSPPKGWMAGRGGHKLGFWPEMQWLRPSPSHSGMEQEWEAEEPCRWADPLLECLVLVLKMWGWPHDWAIWRVMAEQRLEAGRS